VIVSRETVRLESTKRKKNLSELAGESALKVCVETHGRSSAGNRNDAMESVLGFGRRAKGRNEPSTWIFKKLSHRGM